MCEHVILAHSQSNNTRTRADANTAVADDSRFFHARTFRRVFTQSGFLISSDAHRCPASSTSVQAGLDNYQDDIKKRNSSYLSTLQLQLLWEENGLHNVVSPRRYVAVGDIECIGILAWPTTKKLFPIRMLVSASTPKSYWAPITIVYDACGPFNVGGGRLRSRRRRSGS
jgi:hypothetical protein